MMNRKLGFVLESTWFDSTTLVASIESSAAEVASNSPKLTRCSNLIVVFPQDAFETDCFTENNVVCQATYTFSARFLLPIAAKGLDDGNVDRW